MLDVLLDNFVTAANQLAGQMFDSSRLVGELVGLSEGRPQSGLWPTPSATTRSDGQRPRRRPRDHRQPNCAATPRSAHGSEARPQDQRRHRRGRRRAATPKQLDRSTPPSSRRSCTAPRRRPRPVSPHAAGEAMVSSRSDGPKPEFAAPQRCGTGADALVATSGKALKPTPRAGGASAPERRHPGPERAAVQGARRLRHRCARPRDVPRRPRSSTRPAITDYDLFAFHGTWPTPTAAAAHLVCLIRVDSAGARPVAWEILANLTPGRRRRRAAPTPASLHDAEARAATWPRRSRRRTARPLDDWLRRPSANSRSPEQDHQRHHRRRRAPQVRAELRDHGRTAARRTSAR